MSPGDQLSSAFVTTHYAGEEVEAGAERRTATWLICLGLSARLHSRSAGGHHHRHAVW